MTGLAEYVPFSTCPYPQEVATWESIPPAQIASFVPPDFSTAQCFTGLGDYIGWDSCESPGAVGLGALSLTAPDGYFSTGDLPSGGLTNGARFWLVPTSCFPSGAIRSAPENG